MIEHVVKIESQEDKFTNVPANLLGIQNGDRLIISEYPRVRKYKDEQKYVKGIMFEADDYFRMCMANNEPAIIQIDEDFPEKYHDLLKKNGFKGKFSDGLEAEIFPDMVTFVDKQPASRSEEKTFKNYSLKVDKVDEGIIQEMISKVDKIRFRKLMSISMGRGCTASEEVMEKFLDMWAHAKYHFYLAFGRNFTISTPIEYKMDEMEMRPMVYGMYSKWPMYAATIDRIVEAGGISAFIENKCPKESFFAKYMNDFYKPGMKISKFFSQCFKNDAFDIDFSKVLQDRMIKGNVVISIDPYDFATSATNMHGWTSCQKIFGNMAGGSFTWITDPNALIAYRDNGKIYHYDHIIAKGVGGDRDEYSFGKNEFDGNSKSWRQIINADINNCAFLFGREYPQNKDVAVVFDAARQLLENVIGEYIGINEWDNYGDLKNIAKENYFGNHPVYKDVSNHHYSDIANWESLKRGGYPTIKKALIAPSGTDMSKVTITAGGKMICFNCGREIDNGSHSTTCGRC